MANEAVPRETRRLAGRLGALLLAAALVLAPAPSQAIAPVLLLLVKQIGRNVAESMLKDAILSGLEGMGCKGIALADALRALDQRRGGPGGLGGLASMASLPGLGAMPAGLAGGLGGGIPADVASKMAALMPAAGQLPAGLDREQMAMLASLQQSMAAPLSPEETIATLDELAELGFLPKPMQSELKECMVVLPTSIVALGVGMAMLKPVIPQLRQARAELHALTAAEQDEVAIALAEEIAPLPAEQRAEFLESLGAGFFPPRVVAGVKERLGAR